MKDAVTSFCECRDDWTDGGSVCQECGKPRINTSEDSFPMLCQDPNCPGGRAECHTFPSE